MEDPEDRVPVVTDEHAGSEPDVTDDLAVAALKEDRGTAEGVDATGGSGAAGEPAAGAAPAVYDTLGPEHAALKEFVADDGLRPVLAGICVRDGRVVVTNGSILVIVPTARQAATDLPVIDGMATPLPEGTEVLVPVAALEKALRLVDKKASVPALQRVVLSYAPAGNGEGPKVLLSATDLETSGTIAVRPISGKFPTYAQVIPSKAGRTRNRLDAARVKALAGYIERHGGTGPMTLYFDPQSELAPVLVEFGEQNECLAVLAPVRVYW